MPADYSGLNARLADLTTQVADTVGTEGSATTMISGFSAEVASAVKDALTADNAADQGSIDAAMNAIAVVTDQFKQSAAALGAAVAAKSTTP